MLKRGLIPLLTIIVIFSCTRKSEGLKRSDVPDIMNHFLGMHVEYNSIDKKIADRTLNNFVSGLDWGKYFFYKNDIKSFEKYREGMDARLSSGEFSAYSEIVELYKKRYRDNMKLFAALIEEKYEFDIDEEIVVDREKVDYASDQKDMETRWRKNIKLQLLNFVSTGIPLDKAKVKLKKRYSIMSKRIEEIDETKTYERILTAFFNSLDPDSNYLSQDENDDFKISMNLKLEGIGARLRSEEGLVTIESLIPGSPASRLAKGKEIKPGDKIIAVAQADGEPVDVIDMDLRDVVHKIRGKKGTEVRLTILRETSEKGKTERLIIPIVRDEINLKDAEAKSDVIKIGDTSIGYIRLPSFYNDAHGMKTSTSDMIEHIKKMKDSKVSGMIIDLRGNPGGALNDAKEISGLFVDAGPVVQIKSKPKNPMILTSSNSIMYEGPIVILIDKLSASASEILAGAIKDYGRGIVIGPSNTFGKGTVQSYNELPDNRGAVKITMHVFYQPDGKSNQLNGISPDLILPDISSIWDIGERRTKNALEWKPIKQVKHKKYSAAEPAFIESLRVKSDARVRSNKKYQEYIQKINKLQAQIKRKTISLKEESQLEKQKEKEFEREMTKEKSKKTVDLENDLFLGEAFNIMNDYIKLVPQNVTGNSKVVGE